MKETRDELLFSKQLICELMFQNKLTVKLIGGCYAEL